MHSRNKAHADGDRIDPLTSPVDAYLRRLHARHARDRSGEVATYIPELGSADPEWFGIALATIDGHVYEVGETRQRFTIQSISKPIAYGLALEDRGLDAVLARVGVEPSGEAFNSISLEPASGRPRNPMINAGAIATTSLIAGHTAADRLARLLAVFSLYTGRPLEIDDAVYRSEKETGHRNRAIGHMLRNFGILECDPEPTLDLYFEQCSIAVDCRDLAAIAACLANGGVNPVTGERALRQEYVQNVLSVMATCGMYDYAGEWVYWVGMPAKSGVAGGVLAVLPGQLGIGVFSPRLDARGNSVRGVGVCRDLSRDFGLHFLAPPRSSRASIRAQYSLADVSSKRLRTQAERETLDRSGGAARVYGVGGDLVFSAAEVVVRRIVEAGDGLEIAVLDLTTAAHVDSAVTPLFVQLQGDLAPTRRELVFVGLHHHPRFARALAEGLALTERPARPRTFPDVDAALEWCEDRLLFGTRPAAVAAPAVPLRDHEICRGLTAGEIAVLEARTERRTFAAGALIIRKGEEADGFHLLVRGTVSVTIDLPDGRLRRFSTLSAGMAFGELAVVDRAPRSADVRATSDVECHAVSVADFDDLGRTHPRIKMTVLENLLRNASRVVNRLNREVATLASSAAGSPR